MKDGRESKVLKVMGLAIKFIGTLDDEELTKLINKEYKFEIKSKIKTSINTKNISKSEENKIIDIANIIKKSEDRDQAIKYIKNLKLTNPKLIFLGEKLGIKSPKSAKKDKIISIIVEDTVGNRLKIAGLREGIMGER